jgi:hypothetical protein
MTDEVFAITGNVASGEDFKDRPGTACNHRRMRGSRATCSWDETGKGYIQRATKTHRVTLPQATATAKTPTVVPKQLVST